MRDLKKLAEFRSNASVALQKIDNLTSALNEACAALEAVADPPEKSRADLPPIQMVYIQCITAARKGRDLLRTIQ